jgi:hypothetical protein
MASSDDDGRLSASELSQAALRTVEELTGYRPEAVTALEWDGEFWKVTVDALELEHPEYHRRPRRVRDPTRREWHAAWLQANAPLRTRRAERGLMEDSSLPTRPRNPLPGQPQTDTNVADILERVLDKGIVIAGDINLLDIELLTIKLRLLIASVDGAREMGINCWESDPSLQSLGPGEDSGGQLERENRELRERLERVECQLGAGDHTKPESGGG